MKMRHNLIDLLIVSLLVLVVFGDAFGDAVAGAVSEIPTDAQIILPSPDHSWTPTVKQTQESLHKIETYLENRMDLNNADADMGDMTSSQRTYMVAEIKKILANKHGYRVQFWGITKSGQKTMVCNFFPTRRNLDYPDEFPSWRKQQVVVNDGGSSFFQIAYDPLTKSITNFQSNGYAATLPLDPLQFAAIK